MIRIIAAVAAALTLTACGGSPEPLTVATAPTDGDIGPAAEEWCDDNYPIIERPDDEGAHGQCEWGYVSGAYEAVEASIEFGVTSFDADSEEPCLTNACMIAREEFHSWEYVDGYVAGLTYVEEWIDAPDA